MTVGFREIIRREKWSPSDALEIASNRIDALEFALNEAIEYRSVLVARLEEAERRVSHAYELLNDQILHLDAARAQIARIEKKIRRVRPAD